MSQNSSPEANRQTMVVKTAARQTVFSSCRRYRYVLWREWGAGNPSYALFIGLNPSIADEIEDDPTIRRCVDYAKRWGYGALCVVNLFAFRATDPKDMKAEPRPIGRRNTSWILKMAQEAGVIVAAWGSGRQISRPRSSCKEPVNEQIELLSQNERRPSRASLYLRKSAKLSRFI